MECFSINRGGDTIEITIQEVFNFPEQTGYYGGYDLNASIKIKAGSFSLESTLYASTGDLFDFYQSLTRCNQELHGTVVFKNYESNLQMTVRYDELGHVRVNGSFSELDGSKNELKFEICSDQTFITTTLAQLGTIASKYGDRTGLNGATFPY